MDKFVIRKSHRSQDSSSTQNSYLTQDSSSTQNSSSKQGRVDVNNLLSMVVILIYLGLFYFRFYIIYVSYWPNQNPRVAPEMMCGWQAWTDVKCMWLKRLIQRDTLPALRFKTCRASWFRLECWHLCMPYGPYIWRVKCVGMVWILWLKMMETHNQKECQ